MEIINLDTKAQIKNYKEINIKSDEKYFFLCDSSEVLSLQQLFHFDVTTLIECLNFDENIRFNSFYDYDFISMVYFHLKNNDILVSEVNIYVGKNYLVLVLLKDDILLESFKTRIMQRIFDLPQDKNILNRSYYTIYDVFLYDLVECLERFEDEINLVENEIPKKEHHELNFGLISKLRQNIYAIKKLVRPLLYIGDQILINENQFITKDNARLFKSIDVRMNLIYDFATSLYEYGNQLMHMYESTITMKTNDIVNKLTILTVFFAPLTLLTGVYGMNFEHMPELGYEFAYPIMIVVMVFIAVLTFIILKLKKWI